MSSYRRLVHHPLAVERAKQIIRKHEWQFHGAGVGEAVRDLLCIRVPKAAPCLGTHAAWAVCKECA